MDDQPSPPGAGLSVQLPEELLRDTLSAVKVPVAIFRRSDGVLVYRNEEAVQATAWLAGDNDGGPGAVRFWQNPARRAAILDRIDRFGAVRGEEIRIDAPDGPHWLLASLQPMRFADANCLLCWIADISESKAAELRAVAASRRLRWIEADTAVLIAYFDRDRRYRFANDHYRQFHDRTDSDIIGQPVERVVRPETLAFLAPYMARVLGGEAVTFDGVAAHADGRRRYLHCQYIPDRDENGDTVGFFAVAEEAAAPESPSQRILSPALLEGTWRCDCRQQGLTWSDEAAQILGLDSGRTPPSLETYQSAIHPDDRDLEAAARAWTVAGKGDYAVGFRTLDARGRSRFVQVHGTCTEREAGRPAVFAGTIRDISDEAWRQAARERRIASEEADRDAPRYAFYVDGGRRVRFASRGSVALLRNPQLRAGGSPLGEVLDDGTYRRLWPAFERAIAGQAVAEELELPLPSGESRLFRLELQPDAGRGVVAGGFLAVLTDITERRGLERRLAEAQKMRALGDLTAGVAHEFNNLLAVVLGNLELLGEDRSDGPGSAQLLQAARRGAMRGAELTDRLLTFSRRQPLTPRRLDAAAVLREASDAVRDSVPEGIAFDVDAAPGTWPAHADPAHLRNALLALIGNAADAMPQGGTIGLSARNATLNADDMTARESAAPGDYVLIEIADSGDGMTPEVLARALEPFFSTRRDARRTGLGLSAVAGFAQQSGGMLRLDSTPGRGTVASLYLPRGEIREAARVLHESGVKARVLVVEDDADVRSMTAEMLRRLGYEAVEAENADRALERLAADDVIDIVFTDIVMPGGMNGIELARKLLGERPHLKVLLTTGYSQERLATIGDLGADLDILRKPYRRQQLADAIDTLCRQD